METIFERIMEMCESRLEEVVAIRRDLHMHPETGFDVHRTAGIAASGLEKLGIEVKTGIGKTGVVGDIAVAGSTERVALRADMDALCMMELGDRPYKSKTDGKAHACGHDAHTAMLIGAAGVISEMRSDLKRNIRFVFQPSEELLPGGAPEMIKDGVLKGVDEIYGLHVLPLLETGQFGIGSGAFMGRADEFEIMIKGKGGHGAKPHLSVDPVMIGCQFVTALQSVVSRNIDPFAPAVVSVTRFHAGTANNIIPDSAAIAGTIRSMDDAVRDMIRERLENMLSGIASANGAQFEFCYQEGYPVTKNDAKCAEKAAKIAENLIGSENVVFPYQPVLGAEDFGYYTSKIPGCLIWLGSRNTEKGIADMCHHPRFDIDENCMVYGMAQLAGLALA